MVGMLIGGVACTIPASAEAGSIGKKVGVTPETVVVECVGEKGGKRASVAEEVGTAGSGAVGA